MHVGLLDLRFVGVFNLACWTVGTTACWTVGHVTALEQLAVGVCMFVGFEGKLTLPYLRLTVHHLTSSYPTKLVVCWSLDDGMVCKIF